ncbi:MAG: T9SS type A sorting domain-containing protein [Salibacteraceae bacterium]
MKKLFILILIFNFAYNANAQDWKIIGEVNSGADIFSDSISDLLYAFGAFDSINGKFIRGIGAWDGQQWNELDHGINFDTIPNTWGSGASFMTHYQGKLIVTGGFSHVGYYQESKNVAIWNTDSLKWETVNWNPDAHIDFVYDAGDTTFVLGTYDSIGGVASMGANYLYQNKWTNMSPPDGVEIPKILTPYQGSYYLGGNMNGSIPGANDIARWDGIKFHPVGAGVSGGLGYVHDLIVYKGELYIGGSFTISSGHIGDYIMKWDGQQYHNVGNANWVVFDFEIHKGILYAAGIFDIIDDVTCNGLAWYDGTKWTEIDYNTGEFITDIVFHKDTLYGQRNSHGKQEILKYQKELPNSVSKTATISSYSLYPNPTSSIIKIRGLNPNNKYRVTNLQGEVLLSGNSQQINISHLSPGIYFIRIYSQHHSQTLKFIKL